MFVLSLSLYTKFITSLFHYLSIKHKRGKLRFFFYPPTFLSSLFIFYHSIFLSINSLIYKPKLKTSCLEKMPNPCFSIYNSTLSHIGRAHNLHRSSPTHRRKKLPHNCEAEGKLKEDKKRFQHTEQRFGKSLTWAPHTCNYYKHAIKLIS